MCLSISKPNNGSDSSRYEYQYCSEGGCTALPELHCLLARLGVEELGQVLAEEELYCAGGAVAMLAHQDVGNVLLLGFRVV